MATDVIFMTSLCMNSYMFCYISKVMYFPGNKERSQKSVILMFFKRKQRNYYVMSLSPVFSESGPYVFVDKMAKCYSV